MNTIRTPRKSSICQAGNRKFVHGLPRKIRAIVQRGACTLALLLLVGGWLRAAERVNWLSGPALRKKLESRESIAWSGQPLRDALEGFSRTQRVAVLIDRRIDPGQPVQALLTDTPLAELLTTVAESRGVGVSLFESVVYLGPPDTARRLRTVLEMRKGELTQLPTRQRLVWLQGRPWRWDDFATPRDLLGELAKEGKFDIKDLERVPHDLWAAADLPPLGMTERLTLVLAQFDYTYRLDPVAGAIQLERMPAEVWVERHLSRRQQGRGAGREVHGRVARCCGPRRRRQAGRCAGWSSSTSRLLRGSFVLPRRRREVRNHSIARLSRSRRPIKR